MLTRFQLSMGMHSVQALVAVKHVVYMHICVYMACASVCVLHVCVSVCSVKFYLPICLTSGHPSLSSDD